MNRFKISGGLLARNALMSFMGQLIPLLLAVITFPLMVNKLGTERFGLLSIAWAFIGFSIIFDFGLGRATTKYIAAALGEHSSIKIGQLFWTTSTAQCLIGLLAALGLFFLTPLIINEFLRIPNELLYEAKWMFYILAISIPLLLLTSSFQGCLEAAQRFDLVNFVRIPANTLMYALPLIGILVEFPLPSIVLTMVMPRYFSMIVLFLMNRRVFPEIRNFVFSGSQFSKLLSFGGWVTLSNALYPIFLYLDRFVIGNLLGMSAVAYFSIPAEAITRLWIIPGSIALTLFPAFSSIAHRGLSRSRDIYLRTVKIVLILVVPIVFFLVKYAPVIISLWLGDEFAHASTTIFRILVLGAILGSSAPISGALLQGQGRPDIIAKIYMFLHLPMTVFLLFVLTRKLGINGTALVAFIRTNLDAIILFLISAKRIEASLKDLIRQNIRKLIFFFLLFATIETVSAIISVSIYGQLGISLLVWGVFLLATWNWVLDSYEKQIIRTSVKMGN